MAHEPHSEPPMSPQSLWRYDVHGEYFYSLCRLISALDELNDATLAAGQLASFSIQVLEDLDVDEASPCDFAPRFFTPLAKDSHSKFMETFHPSRYSDGTDYHWRPTCVAPPKDDCKPESCDHFNSWFSQPSPCCAHVESEQRAKWVMSVFRERHWERRGLVYSTNWDCAQFEGRDQLYWGHREVDHPSGEGLPRCSSVKSLYPHEIIGGSVPHMTCFVTEEGVYNATDVLRGDILAAATLMKRQVRSGKHTDHHIIPVLLFSFQHDKVARIVQIHFDGQRLFIRQSRPLDLNADEPTGDAHLMVRWLASQPSGHTEYTPPACTGEMAEALDTNGPEQPSTAIVVCS